MAIGRTESAGQKSSHTLSPALVDTSAQVAADMAFAVTGRRVDMVKADLGDMRSRLAREIITLAAALRPARLCRHCPMTCVRASFTRRSPAGDSKRAPAGLGRRVLAWVRS